MKKILLLGNGDSAVNAVRFLQQENHRLLVVRDTANGVPESKSPMLAYCKKNNVKYAKSSNFKDKKIKNQLKRFAPDVIFSVHCNQVLDDYYIKLVKGEIFNIHFSLLPKNRGCFPVTWGFLNNEEFAGITLHKLTNGIDEGPIIDQIKKKVKIEDTAWGIYHWCQKQISVILERNLDKILNRSYKQEIQNEKKATYHSQQSINFDNNYIDWSKNSKEIIGRIQAFIFPPFQYARARYEKRDLKIVSIKRFEKNNKNVLPGTVVNVGRGQLEVKTKDGLLTICTKEKNITFLKGKMLFI